MASPLGINQNQKYVVEPICPASKANGKKAALIKTNLSKTKQFKNLDCSRKRMFEVAHRRGGYILIWDISTDNNHHAWELTSDGTLKEWGSEKVAERFAPHIFYDISNIFFPKKK